MGQPVFDHEGCGSHQGEGLRVAAAVVAGDVEHNVQPARRTEHGGCGAGQKAVALQIIFGAMEGGGAGFGQGRTDGVGASVGFMSERAGAQRDALGAAEEIGIAQAVQQQPARRRQRHQPVGVAHLPEDEVHHRASLGQEVVLDRQRLAQLAISAQRWLQQGTHRAEPGMATALPRAAPGFIDQATGHFARLGQPSARQGQLGSGGRAVGGAEAMWGMALGAWCMVFGFGGLVGGEWVRP